MKKVIVIDNYDSFTYNLVHILVELGLEGDLEIYRNDKISLDAIQGYDSILLSPGPGVPKDAGLMPAIIKQYAPTKNILGVCLGHQGIGEAFGASLYNLPIVFHGVTSDVKVVKEDRLFEDIPEKFTVCRYHSWVVDPNHFSDDLVITAVEPEGHIMAIKHKEYEVRGVQFHPESVMTEHGKKLMANWLSIPL
ncbi:MAG: aminodeoxychorismate/anthranilate synthase component II [Saprospiraceae bacterium]|nr:aminodeoxychorismate/anthranilate synthase component II [Saprospiraceae bacterium]